MDRELFDVLDCSGRRTGETIERDAAHETGAWHGAFHCLISYPRNGRLTALFQKRAAAKKIAPGLFDVSAGGHYASGEAAISAGPREIAEELGLFVPFSSLVPLGRRVSVHCFTPGIRELEFQDVFLLPLAARPEGLRLQTEEVAALLELEVDAGIALFGGGAAAGILISPAGTEAACSVRRGDFVPCLDNYYLKLLVLALRYHHGERTSLAI